MACGGTTPAASGKSAADEKKAVAPVPRVVYPEIVAEYPHDVEAYTQGLLCHDGKMYESTGEYGSSSVREVDWQTGKVLKQTDLPDRFFGEGLTLVGDSLLYQLTWNENRCLVYRLNDLKQIGAFSYMGEGWGLTTRQGDLQAGDVDSLYMSDGSSWIRVIDPTNFKPWRRFQVRDDKGEATFVNELEWIEGKLWANIYLTGRIAVIDPDTGFITHYIDCSKLATRIDITRDTDVFNGVAVDEEGRVFVTGKRWNKLFEIKVEL